MMGGGVLLDRGYDVSTGQDNPFALADRGDCAVSVAPEAVLVGRWVAAANRSAAAVRAAPRLLAVPLRRRGRVANVLWIKSAPLLPRSGKRPTIEMMLVKSSVSRFCPSPTRMNTPRTPPRTSRFFHRSPPFAVRRFSVAG